MARVPLKHPFVTTLAASVITLLAAAGIFLTNLPAKCSEENTKISDCLVLPLARYFPQKSPPETLTKTPTISLAIEQEIETPIPSIVDDAFEFPRTSGQDSELSTSAPLPQADQNRAPEPSHNVSSPAGKIPAVAHVPQFPDFILPRPVNQNEPNVVDILPLENTENTEDTENTVKTTGNIKPDTSPINSPQQPSQTEFARDEQARGSEISVSSTQVSKLPNVPVMYVPKFPDFILPLPVTKPPQVQPIPKTQSLGSTKPLTPNITLLQVVRVENSTVQGFSSGKIIIQDGDNLWSISSRLYGAGIHYRAIFEANKDQISHPHWIFPGQILQLPVGLSDAEISQE